MERDKTIARCSWNACLECGLYSDNEGCTALPPLLLSQDGDSIFCESSTARAEEGTK